MVVTRVLGRSLGLADALLSVTSLASGMCFSSNWIKNGMDWTVRRATIADADRLALIGSATFLETFAGLLDGDAIVDHCAREHSSSAYRRYLGKGAEAWLVEACSGMAPVGFSLLGSTDLPGSDGPSFSWTRV